jgi:hypothetical protein
MSDIFNRVVSRLFGVNINRRTIDNVLSAGWNLTLEEHLVSDIVRWIAARP